VSLESKPPRAKSAHTAMVVASQKLERTRIVQGLRLHFERVARAQDPYEAISQSLDDRVAFLVVSLEGLARSDAKFIESIRRHCLDLRTLLLVPEGMRPIARAFLNSGADGMLSSPHDDHEFSCVVQAMMRRDGPDALTGLPNRPAGDRAVPIEIARAVREKRSLGFALLDADKFKRINSRWGLTSGDMVLANIARILRQSFRATDLICRWGGEEFMVLLPGLPPDVEEARAAACAKLRSVLAAVAAWIPPLTLKRGGPLRVTLSGGAVIYPGEGTEPMAMFKEANRRLQCAKDQGRNRIVCSETECPRPGRSEPPSLLS